MEDSTVVRISERTKKLTLAMNKGSVDEGIRFMWAKLCSQGKELNLQEKKIKDLEHTIKILMVKNDQPPTPTDYPTDFKK